MEKTLQVILQAINAKHRFETVDITENNVTPAQQITETPALIDLTSGTYTIPDGLLSYSIYNYGDSEILVNGVSIPSGLTLNETRTTNVGNLIGCAVDVQSSACLISIKSKS